MDDGIIYTIWGLVLIVILGAAVIAKLHQRKKESKGSFLLSAGRTQIVMDAIIWYYFYHCGDACAGHGGQLLT